MDSDEQQHQAPVQRADSPSGVSTTSSASPLVRNGSSSSAASSSSSSAPSPKSVRSSLEIKRPAPTSIAAAQHQQRLDSNAQFNNNNNHLHAQHNYKLQNGNKLAQMVAPSRDAPPFYKEQLDKSMAKKKLASKKVEMGGGSNKSFGYNLAKSIAFRANRFNDFWSVNKMRYINFACLLMTLVCLVTILLVSNSSSPLSQSQSQQLTRHNSLTISRRANSATSQQQVVTGAQTKQSRDSADGDPLESIDSIERQPFVGKQQQVADGEGAESESSSASDLQGDDASNEQTANNSNNNSADGFSLFDDRIGGGGGGGGNNGKRNNQSGREVEELALPNHHTDDDEAGGQKSGRSGLLEPILGQVFDDLDGFGLLARAMKMARASPNGTMKPIVRRDKNGGTTLIISGTFASGGNQSSPMTGQSNQTAQSVLSSGLGPFFERLLPPLMMAAPSNGPIFMRAPNARISPAGFATLRIQSEPMFGALNGGSFESPFSSSSSSSGISFGLRPFALSGGSSFPLGPAPSPSVGFGPLSMSAMGPPPGLLSMILRASNAAAAEFEQETAAAPDKQMGSASGNKTQVVRPSSQDNLQAQASQQQQQVAAGNQNNATQAANGTTTAISDDVETFDVGQMIRANNRLHPPMRRQPPTGGSMIVISSSSSGPPIGSPFDALPLAIGAPFGRSLMPMGSFESFSGPRHPHSLLLGDALSEQQTTAGHQQLSPMLRTILQGVMSDLSASATGGGADEPVVRMIRPAGIVGISARHDTPMWMSPNEQAEENDSGEEEWAEPAMALARRGPRARNRPANGGEAVPESGAGADKEMAEQPAAAATATNSFEEFVGAPQMDLPEGGSLFGPNIISSSEIGGPGIGVSRIFKALSSGRNQQTSSPAANGRDHHHQAMVQQVAEGVRSQSISRADEEDRPTSADGGGKLVRLASFGRMMHHDNLHVPMDGGSAFAMAGPRINLISRNLGEKHHQSEGIAAIVERIVKPTGGAEEAASDLEEGDAQPAATGGDESFLSAPPRALDRTQWLPKIRVASARIRISPMGGAQPRNEAEPFLKPAAHFTFPAPIDNDQLESEQENQPLVQSGRQKSWADARQKQLEQPQQQQNSSNNNTSNQKQQAISANSQDDSSLEERLSQVLSTISAQHANQQNNLPQRQPQQQGAVEVHDQQKAHQVDENSSPFTSPFSPLFGFPATASSPQQPTDQQQHRKSAERESEQQTSGTQASETVSRPPGLYNRRQRAFTYHSNHELAGTGGQQQQQQQGRSFDRQQGNALFERPRFAAAPILPPPAAVVMGRRLDDGPLEMLDNHQSQANDNGTGN